MSTVLKPERKPAGEIQLGDRVCKTKHGTYQEVMAVQPGEKAVWLHLEEHDPSGKRIGFSRIRPQHTTKLWVLRAS